MYAIGSLKMQFCAGPEKHTFYACEDHINELEAGKASSCFLSIKNEIVMWVNTEDEILCDLCKQG